MSETNSFHDRLSSATFSTPSSASFVFDEEMGSGWLDPLNDIPIPWRVCDVERGAQVEDVDPRGLVP